MVTSAKMVVWNSGKESIHPEHRLQPVRIVTEPRVPILQAKLLKRTRNVTAFSITTSQAVAGEVELNWKILENMDGALIQLIYEGTPDVRISVEGTIEGQHRIRSYKIKSREALQPRTVGVQNPVRKAAIAILIGLGGIAWVLYRYATRAEGSAFRGGGVLFWSLVVIVIGVLILKSPAPPFVI